MQNLRTLQTTGLGLELFHTQTSTSFDIPPNYPIIRIGKPNEQIPIDIDVLTLPSADIVSRVHAEIIAEGSNFYLMDVGSSNGTYLNDNKLESHTRYQLNLGDKIDLGSDNKVSFIFQYKQQSQQTAIATNKPTTIQLQAINNEQKVQVVDRKSKFVGLASMLSGILMFAANTRIGFGLGFPTIILWISGLAILLQRRINRNWGWGLIGLGTALLLFSGRLFASFNLLAMLLSAFLIFIGYQLFRNGEVFGYSLNSVKRLFKR
ncbi:FHA domain-containing protein [Rivularia sp. PCC 7116]|uniref:FHA domain-containing protein n=1 Tax=Rivularia sp. PCC 7116 TaxID=373994 RepID=UPI0005C7A8BA|nr:FHA domain-containing protein [Rivularia sp. PCC 7116]